MSKYHNSLLKIYPDIDRYVKSIDREFMRKIMLSKFDTSPALSQCNDLVKLTNAKKSLLYVKQIIGEIYESLTEEEKGLVGYKYFNKKCSCEIPDIYNRTYYRKQNKLDNKLQLCFIKRGVTQEWFNDNMLKITSIKERTLNSKSC